MNVLLITCSYCKVGLYSRCVGDERTCDCGNVRIKTDELQTFVLDAEKDSYSVRACKITASAETLKRDFDEILDRFGRVCDGDEFFTRTEHGPAKISGRNRYVDQVL